MSDAPQDYLPSIGVRRRLMPPRAFARRVAVFAGFGIGGIGAALLVGMLGYRAVADLPWIDAYLNAAMILSGMGPVSPMPNVASKVFSGLYAILGGLAWSALVGIILYPFVHRMLHALHLQAMDEKGDD